MAVFDPIDYTTYQSPQFFGIRNLPNTVPYEEIVRGRASALPQVYEAQRAREIEQQRIRDEQAALDIARSQARIGTAIEAGSLGVQAGVHKAIPTFFSGPEIPQRIVANPGMPGVEIYDTVQSDFGALAGKIGGKVAGETGAKVGTQVASGLSTAGSYAAAPFLAGNLVKQTNFGEWADKHSSYIGKKEADMLGGAASGALTGFISTGFNPLGALAGALFGGAGSVNKMCIIVTACYGEDSAEVQVAREYRDARMDATTLRGYYMLSEQLVPAMEADPAILAIVKVYLVDKLLDYGRYALGYIPIPTQDDSERVTKLFLSACRTMGATVPSYTRLNGEVV